MLKLPAWQARRTKERPVRSLKHERTGLKSFCLPAVKQPAGCCARAMDAYFSASPSLLSQLSTSFCADLTPEPRTASPSLNCALGQRRFRSCMPEPVWEAQEDCVVFCQQGSFGGDGRPVIVAGLHGLQLDNISADLATDIQNPRLYNPGFNILSICIFLKNRLGFLQ